MNRLTNIEKLDAEIPGLEDQVTTWFDQGIPVYRVAKLLFQKYNVTVPVQTVGNHRARRWVRDYEWRRKRRIATLVNIEIAYEKAARESLPSVLPRGAK